jgi:leader peptidase (prepilin peptidase)/N-methyltransferase
MSGQPVGALIAAVVCILAAPYLARLTCSVPDRERRDWWRGSDASRSRVAVTALVGAVVGGLAGAAGGATWLLPAFVLLALAGTPLVLIDYEHHRLPNRLVVPAAGGAALLVVAAAARDEWTSLLHAGEGAAAVFAVLLGLALISPSGFGLGDVKLGGVLGAFLGWFGWRFVFYGIFAGFLLGSLVGIAMLVSRRGTRKTAIAFGPMLIVGALLVLAFDLVPTAVG